jgi:hypothetical protein
VDNEQEKLKALIQIKKEMEQFTKSFRQE